MRPNATENACRRASRLLDRGIANTDEERTDMNCEKENEVKTNLFLYLVIATLLFGCQSRETASIDQSAPPPTATDTAVSTTASYDLQFIDTMKRHHQTAVHMAQMAQGKASDAKVKEFARKAVADQTSEIQQLEQWRNQWFPNAPDAHSTQLAGANSMNMDMAHMQNMTGHAFDMMFVDMMIPHHQGAIEMSREALQRSQRQEINSFAQQVIEKQQKEIAELQAWKKSMAMPKSSASNALPDYEPLSAYVNVVKRVESSKVCMVTERVFPADQIPVKVGGKTYFGCCDMCKTQLAENSAKRSAIDPVSKRSVDKADAVIGEDKRGRVYYFENERNLREFTPPV